MESNLTPATRTRHDSTEGLHVAVIGGSLTGPIAALLLLQTGIDVTVYEATPATVSLAGGLIGLEHSALDVLERLGIDQHEILANDSETILHTTVRDRQPTRTVRRTYPGRNTTWALLNRALTARVPAGVLRNGMRVTNLRTHTGRPLLHFADNTSAPADLVVFADGRRSIGRRLLDPDRALRYAGYVAHRGISVGQPQPDLRDFIRLGPCPGAEFAVAPVPGGCDWTFYLGCTAREYQQHFGASPVRRVFALPQHVGPAARAHVDSEAEMLPPDYAALVRSTNLRMAVPMLDIDPPTQMVWPVGNGHAVLLGDALAPVRPHTARGANNGIEQAADLAAALGQHHKYGADLPAALNGWQRRQLPTALAAVHEGPLIGELLGFGTRR